MVEPLLIEINGKNICRYDILTYTFCSAATLLLLHVLLQSLVDSMPTHAGVPRLMLQSPRNQNKVVKGVVHGDLATPRGSELPLSHIFPAHVELNVGDADLTDPDILDMCDMCQKHASTNRRHRPGVTMPHWPQMMVSNGCRSARGLCKYVRISQSMQILSFNVCLV